MPDKPCKYHLEWDANDLCPKWLMVYTVLFNEKEVYVKMRETLTCADLIDLVEREVCAKEAELVSSDCL